MALAKKCDRCGTFYEHYPKGNKIQCNAIKRVYNGCFFDGSSLIKEERILDLCPECMSKFDKFMTEGKFGDGCISEEVKIDG